MYYVKILHQKVSCSTDFNIFGSGYTWNGVVLCKYKLPKQTIVKIAMDIEDKTMREFFFYKSIVDLS